MAVNHRQCDVYCSLKEYDVGELELPLCVNVLLKHHNCYAAYNFRKVYIFVKLSKTDTEDDSAPTGTSRVMRSNITKTEQLPFLSER